MIHDSFLKPAIALLLLCGKVLVFGQEIVNSWDRTIGGNHYRIVSTKAISWDRANQLARSMANDGKQGHLAIINSESENWALENFANQVLNEGLWIGAAQANKDQEPGGHWVWVDPQGGLSEKGLSNEPYTN